MDTINYYRLRKVASDNYSTAGDVGARLLGAGLTGGALGGVGSLLGGLGTYAVADLINRYRYRNALNKSFYRRLANSRAAAIGAGVGGAAGTLGGLYVGSKLGSDLYRSATNKREKKSAEDIDREVKENIAMSKLYDAAYRRYNRD